MPDVHGPFDAGSYQQQAWYRDRGYLEPSGVQGTPAATPAAGDLGLTASGFGLTMGLGRAHVRGAYYERTGTGWTYTVPANTSTAGPRYDMVVLRRDLTAKTVVPTVVQGTAAASPTEPALSQSEDGVFDLPLFRITVPANSGTPLVIDDRRRWIDPANGQLYPLFVLVRQSAVQTLANAAWTPISFQATHYDDYNAHNPSSFPMRFTAPIDGIYRCSGGLTFAGNDAGRRGARWNYAQRATATPEIVGNAVGAMLPARGITSIPIPPQLFTVYAGGWVELQGLQESGGNLDTFISADTSSYMLVESMRFL